MADLITWYRCNECGWEHKYGAMANQCSNCGKWDTLHVISNRDGEMPKSDIFEPKKAP